MASEEQQQRRNLRRQRVLKGGRIVFNGGYSTIDCTIRDLTAKGARLRVDSIVGVPEEFELEASDGRSWRCRVRWRSASECGVEFQET